MKRDTIESRRVRVAAFIVVMLAGFCGLHGCDSGPSAPDVVTVASPAPSPSPTPTPYPETHPLSCLQKNLKLSVVNGAGNDDVIFDYREFLTALASPRNAVNAVLPQECSYSRVVGWQVRGPGCSQYGDLTGFVTYFKCLDPGDVQVIATHGEHKAVWGGLLIRNRAGVLEIDPASATLQSFRRVGAEWVEITR